MSESALAIGCLCSTTFTAAITAIRANRKKKNRSMLYVHRYMSHSGRQCHQETGDEQIQQRRGKQALPGKTHQLVVPETGQRCANPHENEKQKTALGKKPEERHQNRNRWRKKHQASQPE